MQRAGRRLGCTGPPSHGTHLGEAQPELRGLRPVRSGWKLRAAAASGPTCGAPPSIEMDTRGFGRVCSTPGWRPPCSTAGNAAALAPPSGPLKGLIGPVAPLRLLLLRGGAHRSCTKGLEGRRSKVGLASSPGLSKTWLQLTLPRLQGEAKRECDRDLGVQQGRASVVWFAGAQAKTCTSGVCSCGMVHAACTNTRARTLPQSLTSA